MPVTKRAQQKAATRAAVLHAARRTFHQQGFERAKIADIAQAADVSPGTVLNAAPNKITLLCEVMMDDFEQLAADTEAMAHSVNGSLQARINAVLNLHLERHLQDLELFRAAIGHNWLNNVGDYRSLHAGLAMAWSPILSLLKDATDELPGKASPDLLTECLLDLYLGVLRRCVIHSYGASEASEELHRRLTIIFGET